MDTIVILGDSLSLPRIDEGVEYKDTYPYLLGVEGFSIVNRSRRANDSNEQLKYVNMYNDIYTLKPTTVIVHLGIVDCAPRLFYRLEGKIFHKINKVIPIIKILTRYRYTLTKVFPKVYVKIGKFKKNIDTLLNDLEAQNIDVIVVGIADTTKGNKNISYRFEEHILEYTEVLKQSSKKLSVKAYIDMFSYGEDAVLGDGIHLNRRMHKVLTEKLSIALKSIMHDD